MQPLGHFGQTNFKMSTQPSHITPKWSMAIWTAFFPSHSLGNFTTNKQMQLLWYMWRSVSPGVLVGLGVMITIRIWPWESSVLMSSDGFPHPCHHQYCPQAVMLHLIDFLGDHNSTANTNTWGVLETTCSSRVLFADRPQYSLPPLS